MDGEEDLADGRLVLLHDPAGHDAWHGTFRLVTLVRAELEPEMAADPLLPDVCWSWLTGPPGSCSSTSRPSARSSSPSTTAASSAYANGARRFGAGVGSTSICGRSRAPRSASTAARKGSGGVPPGPVVPPASFGSSIPPAPSDSRP